MTSDATPTPTSLAPHHSLPGDLIAGRYRLSHRLGAGGMGSVWCAHDRAFGQDVVLKHVPVTADGPAAIRRHREILDEGRNLARVAGHPHVVTILDIVTDRGTPWLVMEHLDVHSLADSLRYAPAGLPPERIARLGAQVADALAAAHAAGIVHRDVKPGNILLTETTPTTALISDFGIARGRGQDDADPDVITGTPAYFAPEVARGHDPTTASDVWSLGASLYTARTGTPPFGGEGGGGDAEITALLERVACAVVPPLPGTTPPDVAVMRLLTPDPAARPTMAQARDLLRAALSGVPRTAPPPARIPDAADPAAPRRRPWWRRG